MKRLVLCGSLLLVAWTGPVLAATTVLREEIGEFKIEDLLIRPNLTYGSDKAETQGFSIGESALAIRWDLEKKYSGVVRIGPHSLVNPTARYTDEVSQDITLVEAYGEYNDVYGRVRMGQIPVQFGYEGRQMERELIFPRSMLFSKRIMMLRDEGVAYDISQNNWYTGFVIHNGESANDQDGRLWYTARWGYKGDNFEIGGMGQTGSTSPVSTINSNDDLADVSPEFEEKWRIGGLFAHAQTHEWEWTAEAYLAELSQVGYSANFATGHTDLSYLFSKTFSTHVRYDYFNNNLSVAGEAETQVSLAVMFSNPTHSSNVILDFTGDLVQGGKTPNNQVRLIWSLSPSGVVRF